MFWRERSPALLLNRGSGWRGEKPRPRWRRKLGQETLRPELSRKGKSIWGGGTYAYVLFAWINICERKGREGEDCSGGSGRFEKRKQPKSRNLNTLLREQIGKGEGAGQQIKKGEPREEEQRTLHEHQN